MRDRQKGEAEKMFGNKRIKQEIHSLKEGLSDYESRNIELRGKMTELQNKISDKQAEIESIKSEKRLAEQREKEVEKENEILRKYYDLDKEPSDEIKAKIHIDLEMNRLKEENLKLTAMTNRQPQFMPVPMPYPQYSPFGRF